MPRRARAITVAGLTPAAVWLVLHLTDADGPVLATGHRIAGPLLAAVPAWLAWRASRVAGTRGARRMSRLMAGAWLALTASSTAGLTSPSGSPVVPVLDLVVLALVLAGLLTVPVRDRRPAGRLGAGLDIAVVQLAGLVLLWYLVLDPGAEVPGVESFARTAAGLAVLVAIARLVLGGMTGISRGALLLYGAAGVVNVLPGVLPADLAGTVDRHYAPAAWALFVGLLTAAEAAQLRAAGRRPRPVAAGPRRPVSLLPYVAVAAVHGLLPVALRDGLHGGARVVLGGALFLTGLVLVRQIVAVRDSSRLAVRLDDSVHALRRSTAREQVLGDLGGALPAATDVAQVHRLAVCAAEALLAGCPGARASVIAASSAEPDTTVAAAAGAGPAAVAGRLLPAGAISAGLLARLAGGEVVTVADPGVPGPDPDPAGLDPAGLDRREHRALTLLPLVRGGRFLGVLSIGTTAALPAELRPSLETLRTQVSLALDSVALTGELTGRAMRDALTGLGNRALLRDRLTASLARARRTGRPVGVLLLDLNGFKPINDTYGHEAGDEVLRAVADRLRDSVRAEDVVGRLGGDEFVVIAEDLRSARDAIVVAERILHALDRPVRYGRHRLHAPAGLGIALSHSETAGPDDLLRLADAAMHTAKRAGGGRFHLHGVSDPAVALPQSGRRRAVRRPGPDRLTKLPV